jgi:peptide/nickel transport system permease protein
VQGDFGASYTDGRPVTDDLVPALQKSAFLALFAFILCVPIGIIGGVIAALRRGRLSDRAITITGLSFAVMPEFVNAVLLQTGLAAGKPFSWFPEIAGSLLGASLWTRIDALFLPAVAVALVLFGYIARIARAGMIEALSADYTRTDTLKGLPRNLVLRRHVIRNAILPTIAVVATQTGYLFGGLVAIEKFFGYPGIGQLILSAAQIKNFPMLQACVFIVGVIYFAATLLGDILSAALNPRVRLGKSA